jgi:2-haloacid dehalogenase
MTSPKTVIAFDLYGTLLSTASISTALAHHFPTESANSIAALWRRYQLEYTWRLNSMCTTLLLLTFNPQPLISILALYKPFSEVTHASLLHALAEHSVSLTEVEIASLMAAYDSLDTFPDVAAGLRALAAAPGIEACVFSNGSDAMVHSSVTKSPSLSAFQEAFARVVTVEQVRVFKPDPRTYRHLAESMEVQKENVWLVSGNPFDIVGARDAGMQGACSLSLAFLRAFCSMETE